MGAGGNGERPVVGGTVNHASAAEVDGGVRTTVGVA